MAHYKEGLRLGLGRQEKCETFELINFGVSHGGIEPGRKRVVAEIEFKALSELLISLKRLLEVLSLPYLQGPCELLLYAFRQDVQLLLVKQLIDLLGFDLLLDAGGHEAALDHLYDHVLLDLSGKGFLLLVYLAIDGQLRH